jgi:hypothetical protein
MAAGILYLGTTSAGLVKAGRTSRPIGVREREFRTVDPGFRIVYTQTVTDVVAAEREMHARLRIVAGTDFKGAGKETYNLTPEVALKAVRSEQGDLVAQAHAAVQACKLPDGLTIGAALRWVMDPEVFDDDVVAGMMRALSRVGIHSNFEVEEGHDALGYLWSPDRLLAAYPELAPHKPHLREYAALY